MNIIFLINGLLTGNLIVNLLHLSPFLPFLFLLTFILCYIKNPRLFIKVNESPIGLLLLIVLNCFILLIKGL